MSERSEPRVTPLRLVLDFGESVELDGSTMQQPSSRSRPETQTDASSSRRDERPLIGYLLDVPRTAPGETVVQALGLSRPSIDASEKSLPGPATGQPTTPLKTAS
jgi:hypothetical protein